MFLSENPEKNKTILNGLVVIGIILITFLCYSYSINNQFTNWDDHKFITKNPYIKNLNNENIKMILFHDITNDYFNPLTMVTYALNYHFSGIEPEAYFVTNILLHLGNTCLVFYFTLMLLNFMQKKGYGEINGKLWIAA